MNSVLLEDVVDKIIDYRGKTPKKLGTDWKKSGIPAISAKNIKNGAIVRPDSIRYVDKETYKKWMKEEICQGDVLMTSEAPLGETYYVKDDAPFVLSQRLFAMRTNPHKLDARYFYILTKTQKFQRLLQTYGTGATVSGIRQQLLRKLPLEIADIETQKKIANVAWDYDALIENNFKRIEKLESMARLFYRHYFETPESEGWQKKKLDEFIKVQRGKSYSGNNLSENDGLSMVNLKCFERGGGFRKSGLKRFVGTYSEKQTVKKGDIVLCNTDMTQERLIVARSAIVPTMPTDVGIISHHVYKIVVNESIQKLYVYGFLRWSQFPDVVKNYANGANVLGLPAARITDYEIVIPPLERQIQFSNQLTPILDLIDKLQLKNEALEKARNILLPSLTSGKIEL